MSKNAYWTKASFECYDNNCQCSERCSNYATCCRMAKQSKDGIPPMKHCVESLLTSGIAIPLAVTDGVVDCMSERDIEVLRLWAKGLNPNEIANELKATLDEVENHRKRVYRFFSYGWEKPKNQYSYSDLFSLWARENLIPELDRLRKVGVSC